MTPRQWKKLKCVIYKDNKNIKYVYSKYSALQQTDVLMFVTEWKGFISPDFEEISKRLSNKIIFYGRNQYDKSSLQKLEFEYYQIGVK